MTPEDLATLQKRVDDLVAHNELLAKTLRQARAEISELHQELEKLGLPPNNYGIFLNHESDGLINISFNSRQMRVAVNTELDYKNLSRGQLVVLNDAMNVIEFGELPKSGQLATFLEPVGDGDRILVRGLADEIHVVQAAEQVAINELQFGDNLLCDLRVGYAFERIARSEIEDLLLEEVPDISYEDIGGLQSQIESIIDAVELPFLQAKLFAEYALKAPKGILLYGPPGCGKTLIAKAVANSIAKKTKQISGQGSGTSYFINIKGPELLNKYVGETEKQIRTIFQRARERAEAGNPVIVFFDEMDALFRTRGSGVSSDVENTIVPQLLSEIDGVEGLEHVIVIGASNREDMIDPAILRPGRLDVKIRVERPNQMAAAQIFSKYLTADVPIHDESLQQHGSPQAAAQALIDQVVAQMYETSSDNEFLEVTYANGEKETLYFSDFNSGAMIENIVARAKKYAIKNELSTGQRGVSSAHLAQAALDEFRENEDLPNTTNPDDWAKISGQKGQQIVYMRTLIRTKDGKQVGRTIETAQ
ncbi:MAG: proteasome ATPase [Actinobacteria bacterium]|nr:proteasome ATPase [Actinomycetota bacterium]NBY14758.1 proteasome ATPase [Actinomycetota bacterium]